MASYILGQPLHDPPPYVEIEVVPHLESHVDIHEQISQHLHVDHSVSPWISHYHNSFETYVARHLSEPILHTNLILPHSTVRFPTTLSADRSMSISPSMLNKSASISVQEEVVWYSSGKETQVGGKKPPRIKDGGEGKGKGKVLGKRKIMDDLNECVEVMPIQDTPAERTRREVNVETGLNTIKRIKLIFHDSSTDTPLPGTSRPACTNTNLADVDGIPQEESKNSDVAPADLLRVTPPAVIEPGQSPSSSSRLADTHTNPMDVDGISQEKSKNSDIALADSLRVTPPAVIEPGRSPPSSSRLADTHTNPMDVDGISQEKSKNSDIAPDDLLRVTPPTVIEVGRSPPDASRPAGRHTMDVDGILHEKSKNSDITPADLLGVTPPAVIEPGRSPPGASRLAGTHTIPMDVDGIPQEKSKNSDIAPADLLRVTPPAVIEPGRSPPGASRPAGTHTIPMDVDGIPQEKSKNSDVGQTDLLRATPPDTSPPGTSRPPVTHTNPVDADGISPEKSENSEIARADSLSVTPPAVVEPGRPLPHSRDLFLDGNTPPATVTKERTCQFEVLIPMRKFDKSMYPVFLGKDAKQTIVSRKLDGRTKGVIFDW